MKRLVPIAVVLALLCAVAVSAAPRSVKSIAAARAHAAKVAAHELLHEFVPPPGAQVAHPGKHAFYVTSHGGPGGEYSFASRFWILHSSPAKVVSFEQAHAPRGFAVTDAGTYRHGSIGQLTFERPKHGFATRVFEISVAKRRVGTVLRVDAQVVWIYPRSPKEVVPAGTRAIDVKAPKVARHVTDSAKIHRIIQWFNRLPVKPPIGVMCGAFFYKTITLVFRSASGGRLASARVPAPVASMCATIDFKMGGKEQTPLIDKYRGPSFAQRLERLLGFRLKR